MPEKGKGALFIPHSDHILSAMLFGEYGGSGMSECQSVIYSLMSAHLLSMFAVSSISEVCEELLHVELDLVAEYAEEILEILICHVIVSALFSHSEMFLTSHIVQLASICESSQQVLNFTLCILHKVLQSTLHL